MTCVLVFDHRFHIAPGGRAFTSHNYNYALLSQRYLSSFEDVVVVGRGVPTEGEPSQELMAEGPGIEVAAFQGWPRAVWGALGVMRKLGRERGRPLHLIAVMPSLLGCVVAVASTLLRRPYATEVIGDASEVVRQVVRGPRLGQALSLAARMVQRVVVRRAVAAAFVTRDALQRRYPPSGTAYSTHYSSVQLASDAFASAPVMRPSGLGEEERPLRLVSVGTMNQLYKGFDTAIECLAAVRRQGLHANLTLVGDGRFRSEIEDLAARMGVREQVEFAGRLEGPMAVRAVMARCDVYVAASRTEGVPRALIEAAALGLPAIGTDVGGIPELVEKRYLTRPGDATGLAEGLVRMLALEPQGWIELSSRQIERAKDYHIDVLTQRRRALYMHLRAASSAR